MKRFLIWSMQGRSRRERDRSRPARVSAVARDGHSPSLCLAFTVINKKAQK